MGLIINKAFIGQKSAFKLQLNENRECYIHTGKKEENGEIQRWAWQKAKLNCIELAQIINFLYSDEKTVKFYHKFNNEKTQIFFNKQNEYIFIKIEDITGKPLTKDESTVLDILLKHIILRMNLVVVEEFKQKI